MTSRRGSASRAAAAWLAALLAAACGNGEPRPEPEEGTMAMRVTSEAFEDGAPIPVRHTGEGEDVSPPLAWSGVPEGARELALICDDPDAPRATPWVHWVLYRIPAGTASLPEGAAGVGVEGRNDWGRPGYGGPMPPPGHGVHRYVFALYALDAPLALETGATKEDLLAAMEGHVLAEARLVGTYERR